MIKTNEKPPLQDDLEERAVSIKAISKLKVNSGVTISSYNYASFKSSFYKYLKDNNIGFKFKFKKVSCIDELTIFKIWRIK